MRVATVEPLKTASSNSSWLVDVLVYVSRVKWRTPTKPPSASYTVSLPAPAPITPNIAARAAPHARPVAATTHCETDHATASHFSEFAQCRSAASGSPPR